MTVDTVNTDIFDDNKITGLLCVWFVGKKLERVRFDHRAVEHAQRVAPKKQKPAKTPGQPKSDHQSTAPSRKHDQKSPVA